MATSGEIVDSYPLMSAGERKLHERIRRLCGELIQAEGDQWQSSLDQLRQALREHTEYLRRLAARDLPPNDQGPTETPGSAPVKRLALRPVTANVECTRSVR